MEAIELITEGEHQDSFCGWGDMFEVHASLSLTGLAGQKHPLLSGEGQFTRNASTIFILDALTAGSSPPTRPIARPKMRDL